MGSKECREEKVDFLVLQRGERLVGKTGYVFVLILLTVVIRRGRGTRTCLVCQALIGR